MRRRIKENRKEERKIKYERGKRGMIENKKNGGGRKKKEERKKERRWRRVKS